MEKSVNRRTLTMRLIIGYGVSLALVIIIFSAFVRPEPKVVVRQETIERTVTRTSDSVSAQVKDQLSKLQLELTAKNQSMATKDQEIAARTQEIAERTEEINGLKRQAATAVVTIPKTDERQLVSLKNDLTQRDMQIASMQKQLNNRPAPVNNDKELVQLRSLLTQRDKLIAQLKAQPKTQPVTQPPGGASETVQELQKRNDNLVRGFNTLQTQMGMMTKNYNLVKAENNRLTEQLAKVRNN